MRRSVAATHLARVIDVTGPSSLSRAVAEGRLVLRSLGPDDDLVLAALKGLARDEKTIEAEARAIAEARKWPTTRGGDPYGWARLQGAQGREALPRILRIYEREIFELDAFAREAGDDDVRSLVLATLDGRRSVHAALAVLAPKATLPGAK